MKNQASYVVVYRTGGTDNFEWHRSLRMTKGKAALAVMSTKAGGRHAFYVDADQSERIGLPETFEHAAPRF